MNANSKKSNLGKSIVWTALLVLFGLLALIGGAKTLVVLLPAAVFIWYHARPVLHGGRN